MIKRIVFHLMLAAAVLHIGTARAATATTTFQVQITILDACVITSANDLNFGSHGALLANVDATTTLSVQCTTSLPYTIGLDVGTGAGATVASRKMTGPGAATVAYSLYRDAPGSLLWGNTIGTNTVSGVGTGATVPFTVYGRVPTQTTPAAGLYTDTITVTVTY